LGGAIGAIISGSLSAREGLSKIGKSFFGFSTKELSYRYFINFKVY